MQVQVNGKGTTCHDLTHPLNKNTIFWPGGEGFNHCVTCTEDPITKEFYSAGVVTCAEHGGTHVDAPYHFSANGATVDILPIQSLIGYCHVIDISQACDNNRDYELTPNDIYSHESTYGPIQEGNIVLIRTGWSKHYSTGAKAYLGFDEKIDGTYDFKTSSLSFPGISPEASEVFVSRKIAGVGLDTASLDPGSSKTFASHRILLTHNIYGIENLNTNIEFLPRTGFTLLVMPMKLTGGSGAPARIIAMVVQDDT